MDRKSISLAGVSQEFPLLCPVLPRNSYRCSPEGEVGRTQERVFLGVVEAGLLPAASWQGNGGCERLRERHPRIGISLYRVTSLACLTLCPCHLSPGKAAAAARAAGRPNSTCTVFRIILVYKIQKTKHKTLSSKTEQGFLLAYAKL